MSPRNMPDKVSPDCAPAVATDKSYKYEILELARSIRVLYLELGQENAPLTGDLRQGEFPLPLPCKFTSGHDAFYTLNSDLSA